MKDWQTLGIYRFGDFSLDLTERHLWFADQPVELSPKQFDLLSYFVLNAGKLAAKNELLDAVWADTYISEATLTRNVSWLRDKLRQCGTDETIIKTVPKKGYRFAADVTYSPKDYTDENIFLLEEETLTHLRGEEIITIDKEEEAKVSFALPNRSQPRRSFFQSSNFLLPLALAGIVVIGLILYRIYFTSAATTAIVASPVVPFSGAVGYENTPAFSPDGKTLAYSWNGGEGEALDIYVKLVGAGDPLQLTETEANEYYPAFSPDGTHIAFVRGNYETTGEIIIVPSLGGAERTVARLFSGNYSISFAPDGKSIAAIDTENSQKSGQPAIYLINIETGERRRVTDPAEFVGETTPRFSPDGKNIAFIRKFREDENFPNQGKQDLFVVPAAGGEPRRITFDNVVINSLAWSADGKYIYFVPVHPPNQTILRRVSSEGGEQQIVSTGLNDITNIALSPDGKNLVLAEDIRHWNIWRVLPDGQPGKPFIVSNNNQIFPQFSPDDSRIVFQSDRTRTFQIWTADADGKNLRQITDSTAPCFAPRFSPDGAMIAFNCKNGDSQANFIVPVEGGTPRRLSPEGVQEYFPIWSADGKFIYFISNRSGVRNAWKMNAHGTGEAVRITTDDTYRPTPAPDGKSVYFTKTGFDNKFWRIPADGGTVEFLPDFTDAGFNNYWQITATGIYFIVNLSETEHQLKFYDFADGKIKNPPTEIKIPSNLDTNVFAVSKNIFLFPVKEQASRLMVADLP